MRKKKHTMQISIQYLKNAKLNKVIIEKQISIITLFNFAQLSISFVKTAFQDKYRTFWTQGLTLSKPFNIFEILFASRCRKTCESGILSLKTRWWMQMGWLDGVFVIFLACNVNMNWRSTNFGPICK